MVGWGGEECWTGVGGPADCSAPVTAPMQGTLAGGGCSAAPPPSGFLFLSLSDFDSWGKIWSRRDVNLGVISGGLPGGKEALGPNAGPSFCGWSWWVEFGACILSTALAGS